MDYSILNQLIDFRYRIDLKVGQGGMGQVFRAFDTWNDNTLVALKVLNQPGLSNLGLLKKEISVIRQLDYPSISRVLSGGYDEINRFVYIVSEWAPGVDASDVSWSNRNDKILAVITTILQTLSYLHSHGIIHHDLKPTNCRISETQDTISVKLLDFGLAGQKRKRKNVRGTVDYLPPEQWRSTFDTPVIDLYALGIMIYQFATGHIPYADLSPVQSVRKRGEGPLPDTRIEADWLAPNIAELVTYLTDPNPNYRPASANETLSFLEEHGQKQFTENKRIHFSNIIQHRVPNPTLIKTLNELCESSSQVTTTISIEGEIECCDAKTQLETWLLEKIQSGVSTGSINQAGNETPALDWIESKKSKKQNAILIQFPARDNSRNKENSTFNPAVQISLIKPVNSEASSERTIVVSPRDFSETRAFIRSVLPSLQATDYWYEKIFYSSGGYDLLIKRRLVEEFQSGTLISNRDNWSVQTTETSAVLSDDLTDVYYRQLQTFSRDERLLVDTLSLLPHGIPLAQLLKLVGFEPSVWKRIETNPLFTLDNEKEEFVEIRYPAFRYLLYQQLEQLFIESLYHKLLQLVDNQPNVVWLLSSAIHCGQMLGDQAKVQGFLQTWIDIGSGERLRLDTISALSDWLDDENIANELRAMIGLLWGLSLSVIGDANQAIRIYQKTLTLTDFSPRIRIQLRNLIADLLLQKGQVEQSKEIYILALNEAIQSNQQDQCSLALSALSWIAASNQQWKEAEEYAERSLHFSRSNVTSFERYRALNVKALYEYYVKHDFDAAAKTWSICLGIAKKLGNQTTECDTLNNLGVIAALKGKNALASRYWNRTVEIARIIDYPARLSRALVNVGIKQFESGKLGEAQLSYEQGLRLFQRSERISDQVDCLMNLSEVKLCRALYSDAINDNEQARRLSEKTNDFDLLFNAWYQYAEILFLIGAYESAKEAIAHTETYIASASPQAANRLKILRLQTSGRDDDNIVRILDESLTVNTSDEPIEEARLLFLLLFANKSIELQFALVQSEKLMYIGKENKHDWFYAWGRYFRLYYSDIRNQVGEWEELFNQYKKYPELHWRICWQLGNCLMSDNKTANGKNLYRKALTTLKAIGMNLNQPFSESYFGQEQQRIFRRDVLAANT